MPERETTRYPIMRPDPDPGLTAQAVSFMPTLSERERLLRDAAHDAEQAVECMKQGDWLRADVLLKLAVDQIADAGVLP